MQFERTPKSSTGAVTWSALSDYLRITDGEHVEALAFADVATAEIEAYTDLAILSQLITCTTDDAPGQVIALPVGPVASGATVTVEIIAQDGTATAMASGFWLEAGRFPRLHFIDTQEARLRITYTAGFGADGLSVPADIAHAILAHTVKLFDGRGCDGMGHAPGLSHAAARIAVRYRRVSL
ncbi:head-tail connector protein [Phaeovulum sp.]|uniref:head-tail connector protein n=1 Tax=Phaeovulum sp. TaxID=2934796 RepID=UPI0039E564B4